MSGYGLLVIEGLKGVSLRTADEEEELFQGGVCWQLVEDEGFQFIPVCGVLCAEIKGGELVGEGCLMGSVLRLLTEGLDVALDDSVVLGFLHAVLIEGGTDGHEGIEALVEQLVIHDDMTETVEVVQLLGFLCLYHLIELLLLHTMMKDGQQTGFDAVDEVCIEDDGILSR